MPLFLPRCTRQDPTQPLSARTLRKQWKLPQSIKAHTSSLVALLTIARSQPGPFCNCSCHALSPCTLRAPWLVFLAEARLAWYAENARSRCVRKEHEPVPCHPFNNMCLVRPFLSQMFPMSAFATTVPWPKEGSTFLELGRTTSNCLQQCFAVFHPIANSAHHRSGSNRCIAGQKCR